jgi:hypothetical protein
MGDRFLQDEESRGKDVILLLKGIERRRKGA